MNVPTTLPFFNGTRKQATNRDGSPALIFSPRTQLPPFQIQRPHDADKYIEEIYLVDCDGNELDIRDYFGVYGGWINGHTVFEAFDTFDPADNGMDIDDAVKTTTGAGTAAFWTLQAFTVATGDKVYASINITLNSGTAPTVVLLGADATHGTKSNAEALSDGQNDVLLTATDDFAVNFGFYVGSGNQSDFSATVTFSKSLSVHEFTSVDYIQYNGETTAKEARELILGFTNFLGFPYDTLTTSGTEITSAIYAGSEAYFSSDNDKTFDITSGESYIIAFNLTLNSGQAPTIHLGEPGAVRSNSVQTASGENVITLTAITTSANQKLVFLNTANTNFSTSPVTIYRKDIDLLPKGTYYIKLSDGVNEWYSEWFNIQDVYENRASSLTSVGYDTFISSDTKVISAVKTVSGDTDFFKTDDLGSLANDEVIIAIFFLTLNSGSLPTARLRNEDTGGAASNEPTTTEGVNEIELTSIAAIDSFTFQLISRNPDVTNYSTSEIWVKRQYSPNFVKLQFSNTKDLRGKRDDDQSILYQEGFEQECWLNTHLNTPGSNRVNIGEEKDGILVSEKIITQHKYRIIDYINKSLFEGLIRLPQHDDITIIDEVGNEYTPDIGNAEVSANWDTFDTGAITIEFNDGSFLWTENSDDIT